MLTASAFPKLSAEEAAELVRDGATVGYSGFNGAGAPKAVPRAIAARMRQWRRRGESLLVRILTAAGTIGGDDDWGAEGESPASAPSVPALESSRWGHRMPMIDMQSFHLPQMVEGGLFGDLDLAVVEAIDVVRDGRVYLSTSSGPTPSLLRRAKHVVVEVNHGQASRLAELHDVSVLSPHRAHVPLQEVLGRIGTPYVAIDPRKIVGVVETDEPDNLAAFAPPDDVSERIADLIVEFLQRESAAGRIPPEFLPLQAGGDSLANAVAARLGDGGRLPPFEVYGDVITDAVVDLLEYGRIRGASATSLMLSGPRLRHLYANMDYFSSRLVIRPQEISNNHAVLQRLGIIAVNSVLEVDLFGCANATRTWDGVRRLSGSGDFVRNAYLSFLVAPSASQDGRISAIVPLVRHVDYGEHSPQIVVTEQGLADLRGLDCDERAQTLIDRCAHPRYRDYLRAYIETEPWRRSPRDSERSYELQRNLKHTGSMLPTAAGA